ncbi:MAG: glutamate 5-kinase [Phycisphaerae bacterium]|nr:glutamate 5-kinase [Phycisphaerae bacterium]
MRDFSKVKRIVIKVGTNVLSKDGMVDTVLLGDIARQISSLVQQGRQVILVTSGAIGMGAGALGIGHKVTSVKQRQALAAVGQGILMHAYQMAFKQYDQQAGQVLLTDMILSHRKYYVNLKNAVETMLAMKIVPIVNENDCVSIEEIGLAFGDNDRLSVLVASKIDAELLIMLTDVAGLFEENPRKNMSARLVDVVYGITDEIEAMAGKAGSHLGTGGMKSKIAAIRLAADAGCRVVLADGRQKDVILAITNGEKIGTLFMPKRRLSNRKRWILNSLSQGQLKIDEGAIQAIKNRRSLLAAGIVGIEGDFKAGEVVEIGNIAKGVCDASSNDLNKMLIIKAAGGKPERRKAIVHANNIALIVEKKM